MSVDCQICKYSASNESELEDHLRLAREHEAIRPANVPKYVLQEAVRLIETWHNFNMKGDKEVWKIYYANAPEMKHIREHLSPLK